ncbi:TPA: YadA family autotransporter adhesin, partial [Burkholderia stabilis]
AVNFAGQAGNRKLTGVANGDVAEGSTDAVTGDQLHTVVADVGNLDQRVTNNESSITQIRSDMNSGQIGMVQQDRTTGAITVGADAGGTSVDFAGTNGTRVLTGVANGVADSDVVTVAQLKAVGLIDYTGKELGALTYDDLTLSSATLGGVGGTVLNNVAPGLIASGSMQAVNGGQLYAFQQDIDTRFDALDGRIGDLEAGGGSGGSGGGSGGSGGGGDTPGGSVPSPGTGSGSTAVGAGSDASGSNSAALGQDAVASAENGTALGQGSSATGGNGTAVGQGANASGQNGVALGQNANASGSGSTALGQNANASGSNAVALGAGSVADRDNAVSVGSAGNERQITNVAAGTAPTDAVNLQQMNNSVRSARQDAMGGVAAAMAVAGLPQSTQPGRTFVAMAGSTYGGEYGSALGVSYMTRDGKWTIKASANTSSRGDVGAVVGGGFYW